MPHPRARAASHLAVLLASLFLFPALARSQATAPSLVRDITFGLPHKDEGGEPQLVAVARGLVFFIGSDPAHGGELWRSDGTEEGTLLLKDILPGPGVGVDPGSWLLANGVVFDEAFYFRTSDDAGSTWWKTDGTRAGTAPFLPGFRGSLRLFPVDETLYLFRNCPGAGACELWKSDGNWLGTVKVKTLPSIDGGDAPGAAKAGGLLFFSFPGPTRELWRSDGTEAGTFRIGSFDGLKLGPGSGETGGSLLFAASDGSSGIELWKSDGTEAGTVRVKDLWPGAGSSDPGSMTSLGETVFFHAEDAASGRELWKTDGTEAGTVQVKDIWTGPDSSGIGGMVSVGGTLFIAANDSAGPGLWKSDGTEAGTVRVGGLPAIEYTPEYLTRAGDLLFFTAADEEHGLELWRSDGTESGTFVVKDTQPGPGWSYPQYLIANGETLYYYGMYPDSSGELWKSDGTEEGTVLIKELVRKESSAPFLLTVSGDQLFFGARERPYERSLWRSDGTAAGTAVTHSGVLYPWEIKDFQGQIYLALNSLGVWKTDGTPGGLTQVFRGGNLYSWLHLTEAGGRLFFRGSGPLGQDLYETGTGLVKDLWPGSSSSQISELTELNGALLFRADSGTSSGLWRSDGTAPGTFEVAGIPARQLTRVGNLLYFTVFDESSWTHALWRSDGSSGGTYAISRWQPGDEPSELTEVNGQLFFALSLGTGGQELRRSDGGGTYLLQSFASRSPLTELTPAGTRLYFTAEDANGRELWRNDGTPGAFPVKDIDPGPASSLPQSLTEASGWLVFTAVDPAHGRELWMSDGTAEGTFLVADIAPGPLSSTPEEMTPLDRKVYFSADDGSTGIELWSFEIEDEASTTDTDPVIEEMYVSPDVLYVGEQTFAAVAFNDPDPQQAHTVYWYWGDGDATTVELPPGPGGYGSAVGYHVYTEAGVYTVEVVVADETGRAAFGSYVGVQVLTPPAAPSIENLVVAPDLVPVGTQVSASVAFTDPNPDETHTVTWHWGDGSTSTELLPGGSRSASSSHVYAMAGFYTATVEVTDSTGLSASRSFEHVIVYNPKGPSVKGAGWIPLAAKKGHFQIEAGYPKKGLLPQGKVQFQAPGMDLRSRRLDLLVVSGPTAWLFGEGTCNGQATCQLWIAMTDGQAPGGGGADRLHIRIWSGGRVIFDNEPGTPNEAPPGTAIGGGTIQIKK
jgi:ELWxxDGT repeat protein